VNGLLAMELFKMGALATEYRLRGEAALAVRLADVAGRLAEANTDPGEELALRDLRSLAGALSCDFGDTRLEDIYLRLTMTDRVTA
jgi:hypothetical protein